VGNYDIIDLLRVPIRVATMNGDSH
jgi:hypothetical protein